MGLCKTLFRIEKKDVLINLIVLLVVEFDFSLITTIVISTFTSSGK